MKRFFGLLLGMLCFFALWQGQSEGKLDLERDKPIPAKVIEIIDGDIYKLQVFDNKIPSIRLYQLIGVKTNGNQQAYDYSVKTLLNQIVYFLEDSKISQTNGIHFCYLYYDFELSHNEDLLRRGFAEVDNRFLGASEYLRLLQNQNKAKQSGSGIYNFSELKTGSKIINVNTASAQQLAMHFGVDEFRASKWVARINNNPINQIGELRAVDKDYFTADVILDYTPSIHLKTNLQSALAYEINSLSGQITTDQKITDKILEFRTFRDTIKPEEFDKIPIAESYRRKIKPFVTFGDDFYEYHNEDKVINLLSASEEQMEYALGVTKGQAVLIKSFITTNNYPLRNVEELFKAHFPLRLQQANMNFISDNIHLLTNINRASEYEIRSLFGRTSISSNLQLDLVKKILSKRPFAKFSDLEKAIGKTYSSQIKPYIYFDTFQRQRYLNLNTSGKEVMMKALDIPERYKNQFPKQILNPAEIPSFLLKYKDQITLYTNINEASKEELMLFHPRMTEELVKEILSIRERNRFYELEDIGTVFKDHHRFDVFLEVKQYLVLQ